MSRRQCSVWGCSNRKGRCPVDVDGKRRCKCEELNARSCPESSNLLTLHNIGKMSQGISRVVIAHINKTRKGLNGAVWKPGPEAYICNSHYENFQGPTRSCPNVVPVFFRHSYDSLTVPNRKKQRRSVVRCSAVPMECESPGSPLLVTSPKSLVKLCSVVLSDTVQEVGRLQKHVGNLEVHINLLKAEIKTLNTTLQRLDVHLLTNDQFTNYTGLSQSMFGILLCWLSPMLPRMYMPTYPRTRSLTEPQKFMMVLMRIRLNLTQPDLSVRFDIDQSTVSRILNNWIPFLAYHLKVLIKWPETTIGPTKSPYNHLPNSVAIIDGTEIFIERPSNLDTQKSSYSDYKSHTTVKYLVSIDPFTGVFNYVSKGFSGNSTDRFVVENSSFLDILRPGQRIIADRGFTVRDLFAKKKAFLTIPSFLNGASKLTGQQAMETRTIASVRIKVENALKRVKDFKILSSTCPNRINKKILDDTFIIACALCNLQPPLIK